MLSLPLDAQQEIDRRFARALSELPAKKKEAEDYLAACDRDTALCLRFLYAFLPLGDLLTVSPQQLDTYVQAALAARNRLSYGALVPDELFLNYVLIPRVNNEPLDMSRGLLQQELWERVQGKSIKEAALEVNYWCYEYVTYHPSDDRTLGPLAVMRTGFGRCGEESTFTVCALRSVGIPARQCYVPRWSHCDDNHAWVELWAEDGWHYLGACEPEPVLDKGWFTAAASRAMVVHSRTRSTLVTLERPALVTDRDTLIHSTDTYADCVELTVRVTRRGKPAVGVRVQFQLVNFSRCFSVFEADTDRNGQAVFRTGKGDLLLQICHGSKLLSRRVDTRLERAVTLELEDAKTPAELHGAAEIFDLAPPAEQVPSALPSAHQEEHRRRLAACEAARAAHIGAFRHDLAKGNWPELERFLNDPRFSREDKEELLSTLRPKDFLDCTAEMLADTLACALPYRNQFEQEIYRDCILAPRVANEMLLPVRSALRDQIKTPLPDGQALLDWLKGRVRITAEEDSPELVPDSAQALLHGCIHKSAFGVLFVNLCRACGIPARQNPNTLAFEWLDRGIFRPIDAPTEEGTVSLCLVNGSGRPLAYRQRFTLARLQGDHYEPLAFDGLLLRDRQVLEVPPGHYMLLSTTRQIDGTISVRRVYETIKTSTQLPVLVPEDQTGSRIRQVELQLPRGLIRKHLAETRGRRMALFLEPGKEPTEHLLQELLDCREACQNYGLLLFTGAEGDTHNPTLNRVLQALPHTALIPGEDSGGLQALRRAMGVGDERLPFSLALDHRGRGLYACANYNIHTAQTLLNIQKLSEEKELA